MQLIELLQDISSDEIGLMISETYDEILKHYVLRNWKTAGLDAGHFVEAARRFLEFKLFGSATPVGKSLSNFNEKALQSYLNAQGDEAYRVIIPRLLWALYALRNKRSIGHLGAVPASEIDATILLNGAKWVISEIIRLESNLPVEETEALVRTVIERQEPILWKDGKTTRVLDNNLGARESALVLLLLDGNQSEEKLRLNVSYKNPSNFKKILKRLDDKNLISYSPDECVISPTGTIEAEKIIQKSLKRFLSS